MNLTRYIAIDIPLLSGRYVYGYKKYIFHKELYSITDTYPKLKDKNN